MKYTPYDPNRYEFLEQEKKSAITRSYLFTLLGATAFGLAVINENVPVGVLGLAGIGAGIFKAIESTDIDSQQKAEISFAVEDLIDYAYSHDEV